MQNRAKTHKFLKKRGATLAFLRDLSFACRKGRVGALVIGLVVFFPAFSAHADDEPFQLDGSHWMSYGHYQDADKRNLIETPSAPQTEAATTPVATPPLAVPPSLTTMPPAIAAPSRPIDLPVMPSMNKGFEVKVNSTVDDAVAAANNMPVITPNEPDTAPDIHLADQNWQTPLPHSQTANKDSGNDDDTVTPHILVRMSFLPSQKLAPVPSHQRFSSVELGRELLEQKLAQKDAPPPAKETVKPAVCAAIDAYKKQQLDAIQSDRQTLKALQDAIATLGLQKQLGFMAGNSSSLSNAANGAIPTSLDAPQATSPAKAQN